MADRVHEASPRKRAQARALHGGSESSELTSAAMLGALLALSAGLVSALGSEVLALWEQARSAASLAVPPPPPLSAAMALEPLVRGLASAAEHLLLVLGLVTAAGFAVLTLQRGLPRLLGSARAAEGGDSLAATAAKPDSLQHALFAHAKWLVVTAVLLWPLTAAAPGLLDSYRRDAPELRQLAADLGSAIGLRAVIALSLVGLVDRAVQAWFLRRRLRMTRRELLDERRATEGDPLLHAERRRRAFELRTSVDVRELAELALLVTDAHGRLVGLRKANVGQSAGERKSPRTRAELGAHPALERPADSRPAAIRGTDVLVVWIKAEGELALQLRAAAVRLVFDPQLEAAAWKLEISEPLPDAMQARARAHLEARAGGP